MRACRVHYSGTVQGVGFRYTAMQIARRFDVSGYVRNLPDGRVELLAEGAHQELDGFLAAVAEAMAGCIRNVDVADAPPTGGYRGFDVTR